jgi:predicted RNase H-like HicB family nuclease
MKFTVECEQESDGRWLAEVKELPGVMVYGKDPDEAAALAQALALRVIADLSENGESISQ